MEKTTYKRLESLDTLHGFDLFFLIALGSLAHSRCFMASSNISAITTPF